MGFQFSKFNRKIKIKRAIFVLKRARGIPDIARLLRVQYAYYLHGFLLVTGNVRGLA
jgi:hypothetical protein